MPTLVESLASYVPSLLVRRSIEAPASLTRPSRETFDAVALFADISGFTALAERLSKRGAAGAEDLARLLNAYLGQLADLVEGHGGDIAKFAGDAVLALWTVPSAGESLEDLALRVAACGLAIQEKLHDHAVDEETRLSLKISVGAGPVTAETLGGVFHRFELLLAGPPLAEVAAANALARPGDVVLSPAAWALAGAGCAGAQLGIGPGPGAGFVRLESVRAPRPPRRAPRVVPGPEAAPALRAYIPAAIRARLDAGQSDWLAELRRLTVLFVNLPDLDASTPLERSQEAMAAIQTSLYRYEGSINKISVDDKGASVLAALGLPPLAHEDDAARGARAALAVAERLAEQGLRSSTGVATGLAFCGVVGGATRREYTLLGDVVNVAARLMLATGDGGGAGAGGAGNRIVCDAATADAAGTRLVFEPLPPMSLKGKKEPIAVFRPAVPKLGAGRKAAAPATPSTAFVGRDDERALVARRIAALAAGGPGGVILIEGEAGIGKSRIVQDALDRARAAGIRTLAGAGDSIEATTPYHAWRDAFAALFDLREVEEDPARRKLRVLNRLPASAEVLAHAPLLEVVLPLGWSDNEITAELAGKARADATTRLLTRLLADAARREPLLVGVEDAHWLDSASRALLLAASFDVKPLLLIVATRPFAASRSPELDRLARDPATDRLVLDRLAPEATLEVARRRLGVESFPEAVAGFIVTRAEGNPFFAEELACAMRDARLVRVTAMRCEVAPDAGPVSSWAFPRTVEGVVTSRIDRLGASEQLTLKVASVVGRVFALRAVEDIHPIAADRPDLADHLATLDRLDLTPRERGAPESAYAFKHMITHDVAYGLLPFAQRRQLHRAVAECYERGHATDLASVYPLLAYHWRKAAEGRPADPAATAKAVDYLKKAGDQAANRYANEEAIAFYGEALEMIGVPRFADAGAAVGASAGGTGRAGDVRPDDETSELLPGEERDRTELDLLLALGAPLIATRGYAAREVEEAYSRAQAIAARLGDDARLFPALRGLWAFHIGRASYRSARAIAERLLDLARRDGSPRARLEAHRALGNTLFWLGELEAARAEMERGIELYAPDEHRTLAFLYGQDPDVANRGMQAWPLALQGFPDAAQRRGREALARAREMAHPYTLGYALVHDACTLQYLGLAESALARAEETIALAGEKGFPNWLLAGMALRGWARARLGQAAEGVAEIRQVVALWRSTGAELVVPYFLGLLAEACLRAGGGEIDAGLEAAKTAIAIGRKNEDLWYEPELERLRGELLLAKSAGDRAPAAEAANAFRAAAEVARRQGARLLELRARTALVRGLDRAGATAEAAEERRAVASLVEGLTEGRFLPDLIDARSIA